MHQRVVLRPDRLVDYRHTRLLGGPASLPYVAARARADDILPLRFSARAPRHDVVERKLARGEALPAILAPVVIARKDIPPVELDGTLRKPVVDEQPDDARDLDLELHRPDPVVVIAAGESGLELRNVNPVLQVVEVVLAVVGGNDLRTCLLYTSPSPRD